MNMKQQCMRVRSPVASAEVLIARLVNCLQLYDPDAPLFGIHMSTNSGTQVVNLKSSISVFADMRTLGCLTWYQRQPEADTNAIAYVSWNDLENECP
jgi:hypothetical protein